jgi:hypothetical protein
MLHFYFGILKNIIDISLTFHHDILPNKSFKIPKGQSELVNRRTDNTNNDLQNITHKTKDPQSNTNPTKIRE